MEFYTCYCPNRACSHYGLYGYGAHLVHDGHDKGVPKLLCNMCHRSFSVRHGTAYYDLRTEDRIYTIAMRALACGP
jgi:transposase-like protein